MAMMTVSKTRRLVNPGRKRKLSALQKLFFGSKRQRAAVAKKNPSHRKTKKTYKKSMVSRFGRVFRAMPTKSVKRKTLTAMYRASHPKRKKNVGSIVTVLPLGLNPGRKRKVRKYKSNRGKKVVIINQGVKMARKRTRKAKSHRVTIRRRRRNPVYKGRIKRGVYKYATNPGRRRRRYVARRRHSNPGRKRYARRRNPGVLSGGVATKVLGVIGGVAVTKLLCGFLPASFQTGLMGYLATAAVAVTQGKLAGKFTKSPSLGNDMMVGGLAYLTAKVLNDFMPSIGGYTGISGMGLIGPSSFYQPQVPVMNSMGSFQVPSAVTGYVGAAMPPANAGVGRLRRTGRLM